jgi:hypothetical protein
MLQQSLLPTLLQPLTQRIQHLTLSRPKWLTRLVPPLSLAAISRRSFSGKQPLLKLPAARASLVSRVERLGSRLNRARRLLRWAALPPRVGRRFMRLSFLIFPIHLRFSRATLLSQAASLRLALLRVRKSPAQQTDPFQANPLGRGQLADFLRCSLLTYRSRYARRSRLEN